MANDITPPSNPFRYGSLALDEAFADREDEVQELEFDAVNGQDVVIFAPRRYGKSSLVWKVMQRLVARDVLVAYVNLMTTPNKSRLAEKLAATIYRHIASPLDRVREQALAPFRGMRIVPQVTVDPSDGSYSFSFGVGHSEPDIDATLERLLELPAELATDRGRSAVLILDEFQEIEGIDSALPRLMRTIFEQQPEVGRIYLGSKRHMMERIFNDQNEPFWRSAKKMELSAIDPARFAPFIVKRFANGRKRVPEALVTELLRRTGGHPYATQELCYFLWEQTPFDDEVRPEYLEAALDAVLRSEHAHFQARWDGASAAQRLVLQALAREPGRVFEGAYRDRHGLPVAATVQSSVRALVDRELVRRRDDGAYELAEPFLTEWILALDVELEDLE